MARILQEAGVGTLLFDLLTEPESIDRQNVFDIPLLAKRLREAAEWVKAQPEAKGLRLGYFGASTGAAAALVAAARQPVDVGAVVSRGGRPDLAMDVLPDVEAPTLLIVGEDDEPVVQMNREAFATMRCEKALEIIPGATHLFPEPGALEQVARLARQWFMSHLCSPPPAIRALAVADPQEIGDCGVRCRRGLDSARQALKPWPWQKARTVCPLRR